MLDPVSLEGNTDRFAKIANVAKVLHARCKRKLVHGAFASFRKVGDLVSDSDACFL